MKESYWGYWLIILGVFVVIIMLLVKNITSNTTEDQYTIKQISEAAMVASVDYAYYREFKELKINKEKFVEVFIRMLANQAEGSDDYTLLFTGMYEAPPKVSVEITSKTAKYNVTTADSTDFDLTSRVDAILED